MILIALKRKLLIATGCVCISLLSFSQAGLMSVPRHALKFSPLHAFNPEVRSIQLAYEYRFLPTMSMQLEGGYVLGNVWWSYPSADAKGYKLKQDIRWYFRTREIAKKDGRKIFKGTYVALELHQNRMTFTRDSEQLYEQNGIGLKGGFIRYAPWGFVFDLNAGLSMATTNIAPLGIPLNNVQPGRRGYQALLPIIGLRMGYAIR